jgi:Ti-type conjugative transfer relaxase TraA
VVLVGDAEQLQPIEAGAAFRAVAERVGFQELSGIRRQVEFWQREASRDFARGEPGRALDRYERHGAIQFADDRRAAKAELIRAWSEYRGVQGAEKASLMLAHTRADVQELNERARRILRQRGELGTEIKVAVVREVMEPDGSVRVEHGERRFAVGDRVMFLKNNRDMGVKNGTLGTVAEVNRTSMRVQLEGAERREIRFILAGYAALDYGYAATVHKAQGATLDRTFLLATPGMDRHLAYVGMTRHREAVEVYAGRDDFKSLGQLKERQSRARPKDSTLDYAQRRGLETAHNDEAEKGRAAWNAQRDRESTRGASGSDPIARFKAAQKEFIQVAGIADFDPRARARAAELREEMKRASQEIAKEPTRMRAAEREGIAPQVRNFVRQTEKERGREKGLGRDEGLER